MPDIVTDAEIASGQLWGAHAKQRNLEQRIAQLEKIVAELVRRLGNINA